MIGHHTTTMKKYQSVVHAPVIRFTAKDGRTVQSVSSMSTSNPPQVGEEVDIFYDPADPEGSADRPGLFRIEKILPPVLLGLGAAGMIGGLVVTALIVLR